MHAKRAPPARLQHLKIAARLKPFDRAKAVTLAWHRQIRRVISSNHQKHARVRTAFVRLPCRMQITRAEAHARCHFSAVTYKAPDRLERIRIPVIHFDEGKQSKIISVTQLLEQGFEPAFLERRIVVWEHTRFFVFARQPACDDLCGLDVGLIEWVDAKHGPGDRRGELPAEEFRTERIAIRPLDLHNGMACALNAIHERVGGGIRCAGGSHMNEDAIVAVHLRRSRYFALDRNDSLAALAERFGDQLLEPGAEAHDVRRCNQRRLVTPGERQLSKHHAELETRVVCTGRRAQLCHRARTIEQQKWIGAQQRGSDEAEIRKCRVPAADSRDAGEDGAKTLLSRDLLELRTWIGRQNEMSSGLLLTHCRNGAIEKMLLEDI